MKRKILRVIDANLNRTREGLRVCEDVARFVLNSKILTKKIKNTRHRIQNIYSSFPNSWKITIASRNGEADVGKGYSIIEMKRTDVNGLFFANMQRSKESIRVLEEFLKLVDRKLSNRFKRLRFDLYEIEKKALARL